MKFQGHLIIIIPTYPERNEILIEEFDSVFRLSQWAMRHRDQLGRKYASELARRIDRQMAYV